MFNVTKLRFSQLWRTRLFFGFEITDLHGLKRHVIVVCWCRNRGKSVHRLCWRWLVCDWRLHDRCRGRFKLGCPDPDPARYFPGIGYRGVIVANDLVSLPIVRFFTAGDASDQPSVGRVEHHGVNVLLKQEAKFFLWWRSSAGHVAGFNVVNGDEDPFSAVFFAEKLAVFEFADMHCLRFGWLFLWLKLPAAIQPLPTVQK